MVLKSCYFLSVYTILSILVVAIFLSPSYAIPIGTLSFDSFIPEVNAFNISNYTGDPAVGGYSLPPDLPVFDGLTLIGSYIDIITDNGSQTISLGDISPGPLLDPSGNPLLSLQYLETENILSATLSGQLSMTSFYLYDGSLFNADSDLFSVLLNPSSGGYLTAGLDLAVIDIAGQTTTSVPEPATILLMASGIGMIAVYRIKRDVYLRIGTDIHE